MVHLSTSVVLAGVVLSSAVSTFAAPIVDNNGVQARGDELEARNKRLPGAQSSISPILNSAPRIPVGGRPRPDTPGVTGGGSSRPGIPGIIGRPRPGTPGVIGRPNPGTPGGIGRPNPGAIGGGISRPGVPGAIGRPRPGIPGVIGGPSSRPDALRPVGGSRPTGMRPLSRPRSFVDVEARNKRIPGTQGSIPPILNSTPRILGGGSTRPGTPGAIGGGISRPSVIGRPNPGPAGVIGGGISRPGNPGVIGRPRPGTPGVIGRPNPGTIGGGISRPGNPGAIGRPRPDGPRVIGGPSSRPDILRPAVITRPTGLRVPNRPRSFIPRDLEIDELD